MTRSIIATLIAVLALLSASAAGAYAVTATLNATSTSIANGYTDNGDGTVTADLTSGDLIVIDIWASNAVGDSIQAAFTTLAHELSQSTFLGGAWGPAGGIFEGTCTGSGCTPPKMTPGLGAPAAKNSQPSQQGSSTENWIQVVAHTSNSGTDGTGAPGLGDYVGGVGFEYVGTGGFDLVEFLIGSYPGDAVSGPGGNVAVQNYNSLIFNVPEPGTALLLGLGLMGFGAARRSEESREPRVRVWVPRPLDR